MSTETALWPAKGRYISRVDQEAKKSHGFYVRIPVGTKKKAKFFSDGVYGSKRAAKEAAENYRDEQFDKQTPEQQLRSSKPRQMRMTAY